MKINLFFHIVPMIIAFASSAMASNPAEVNDTISTKKSKGSERNVMLNASDANKPREIQIGLPSEDVNVYENGLPAVYSSAVHKLATHWRSDASLGEVGLMNPSESAITTGNIAYSVNTFSKLGQKEFKGVLNYHTNHFGWQNVDMNVSGGIGDRWLYTASVYQNFDPGSFAPKFENFSDRTQLYHAGLTRLFNNNRGKFSVIYKFSKSNALGSMINAAPFIYVGDGSVKEIPGFKLGTSSYAPEGGRFQYMDVTDGKMKSGRFGDFTGNKAHEVAMLFDYTFRNNLNWTLNAKFMNAPEANYVDFGGSNISEATATDGLFLDGSKEAYTGLVEGRRTWLHFGKVKNALLTSELKKKVGNHDMRLGLNEWYYHLDYHSSSFQWIGTVTEYPQILNRREADGSTNKFRGFNELSPEYTKGYENKLAAYFTDNWQITPKINVYYGARLEYYRMSADQIPYGRYAGFHIGDTHSYTDNDGNILSTEKIEPHKAVSYTHLGKGKAYGLEWETCYSNSRTHVSAAYTLSWSKRNFPTFYNGWYPDKFDNRHKLNLSVRHNFSSRIEAYASWTYHTGNRMTVPQQQVNAPAIPGIGGEPASEWIYEQPNNVSLPAYHRLDLGINFRSTTKRGYERIWNISVYNAYCRMNPLYGKVKEMTDGSFKGKATGMFPILPSFSYTLKF